MNYVSLRVLRYAAAACPNNKVRRSCCSRPRGPRRTPLTTTGLPFSIFLDADGTPTVHLVAEPLEAEGSPPSGAASWAERPPTGPGHP